ncbi:MAG: thioredoxin [Spartobacteria bacterium]|nr:thioredoxin [Spartobacteria bacterium]
MAEGIKELTDATFLDTVGSGVTVVDFWAPWCGPCRMQGPILEQVVAKVGDKATIAKLNVDEAPQTASRFGIRSIPTLLVFKDGEPVRQFVGVQMEGVLIDAIEAAQA